jgi:glyoxylase-like metal-dependent hydrolase (beta-lactamase superfamily II)
MRNRTAMHVQRFTLGPFSTNGYVAASGGEAAIIDAPSAAPEEHRAVIDYVEEQELAVRHLLLTHAHVDHILGCAALAEHFGLPGWRLHPADRAFAERAREQATAFGVSLDGAPPLAGELEAGEEIAVGDDARLTVRPTPGHSPGSVSFLERSAGAVFSGDVLFRGSIGRIQGLPQTSRSRLMQSIEEELLVLDDETTIYPGHGEGTTVGRERASNPFLNDASAPG